MDLSNSFLFLAYKYSIKRIVYMELDVSSSYEFSVLLLTKVH